MYTGGYKTKKDLKASVGRVYQGYDTSIFGDPSGSGKRVVYHVGPSAYDRRWYASVELDETGVIVKVK